MLLQITLARTGWFHRYEAYLVIWGVLAVVAGGRAWLAAGGHLLPAGAARAPALVALLGAGLLVLLGMGIRTNAWTHAPEACREIATQHMQMARFAEMHYRDAPIVLNDVGYVAYLVRGPILDLGGLASHSVALAKSNKQFDAAWVERAADRHGAVIGINYDLTVIPKGWDQVASWHTGARLAAGDDTVHFHAIQPGSRERLLGALVDFEDRLPPEVTVEYHAPDERGTGASPRGPREAGAR